MYALSWPLKIFTIIFKLVRHQICLMSKIGDIRAVGSKSDVTHASSVCRESNH
jgi:hypothetical protein